MGANLGDPVRQIARAVELLGPSLTDVRVAPLYVSRPVSELEQPSYVNTALTATTRLSPVDLLAVVKRIEHLAGRRTGPRWGPRRLDVDVLIYGDLTLEGPELTLPHPRMIRRGFVLRPLADIAPGLPVPPDGRTVAEYLAALPGSELESLVRLAD